MLKPLAGGPGLPGLKCTGTAATTKQQTVACGVGGLTEYWQNIAMWLHLSCEKWVVRGASTGTAQPQLNGYLDIWYAYKWLIL